MGANSQSYERGQGGKGSKNKDSRIPGFKGSSEKIIRKAVEVLYPLMFYLNPRTLEPFLRRFRMKKTACMMVCVVLIVLFAVPFTFGQALDGQWLQMKVSHKGYGVNPGGIYKISGSITNYMYLTWDGVNSRYDFRLFRADGSEISQGIYGYNPYWSPIGDNEEIAADVGMEFAPDSINYIDTHHTSFIKIKRDSRGTFKSATYNSLGCQDINGGIGDRNVYGGCVIKGKTIDPSKLPFTP